MHRLLAILTAVTLSLASPRPSTADPIYITFVWHMHQPIYWPGESVVETAAAGHYGFDVVTVHTDRSGPYTSWPSDAVGALRAAGLGRAGAQVSFSGSLMENLDALEAAGRGFAGWKNPWRTAATWLTDGGHPAIDLVNFVYFHPLSALIPAEDLVFQLRLRARAVERRFPGYPASHGLFPPETAFSEHIIPALRDAGVEWVVVDNVHFDRTLPDYAYVPGSNLVPPNPADQSNAATVDWVQLTGIWAPSRVSAPWGYQPHRARYIDPATGEASEIVAVPGARYEGNEDARGGFGALNYDAVLSQLEPFNTDPAHPVLVVLHHDGDNYGGGADSYYHSNFAGFVSWLLANPTRFQAITVEEYLERFPPAAGDVIHVEDGSWSGADNGDPEFLKWNGDPAADGYSPDRTSWAVITAAVNRLHTAAALLPAASADEVLDASTDIGRAWRETLAGETSCYWYWDGAEGGIWDSHPSRAANRAAALIDPILAGGGAEVVPPSVYPPQREPYNPGGIEWGTTVQPEDFEVWTYAYDVSGLSRVELWWRPDDDGAMGDDNHRYGARPWCVLPMVASTPVPRTDPAPLHLADRYAATVAGQGGSLVDYFVRAEDSLGNVEETPIRHVFVGDGGPSSGGGTLHHYPPAPTRHDVVTVVAWAPGFLHWGIDGFGTPPASYWPAGSTLWTDGRAIETPLVGPEADGRYTAVVGPFDGATTVGTFDYVIHFGDGSWSSPDQHVAIENAPGDVPTVFLAEPEDGDVMSVPTRLIAAAGDDDGVPTVTFLLDGTTELATDVTRPFETTWDPATAGEGAHSLAARAADPGGNVAAHEVHVTVSRGGTTGDCTNPWGGDADADADADGDADGDADADADSSADAAADTDAAEAGGDARPDGSGDAGTGDDTGDGCSCRATEPGGPSWLVAVLVLPAWLLRRRPRR